VIHAGIYYPTGSLKARLCVEGSRRLKRFCDDHGVPRRTPGKLIVAVEQDEIPELERLAALGNENGAADLRLLEGPEVRAMEPHVRAVAALHSPGTGIVDSHELMKALEAQARGAGGHVAYRCAVTGIHRQKDHYSVRVRDPAGQEAITCRAVINCAGLEADRVAALAGAPTEPLRWCKGAYFTLGGPWSRRVKRLIYPAPNPRLTSLGIHLTLDLAGRTRLGPDVTYVARDDVTLDVDPSAASRFHEAASRYLPGITVDQLSPDTAGIRPKLQGPDDPWRDFVVREESAAGLPGLVNLLGIESPGLTSCLPLADLVVDTLRHLL